MANILDLVGTTAATGSFIVDVAPHIITYLRATLKGPELQEAVDVAAYVLDTMIECQHMLRVPEMDEISEIFTSIQRGIATAEQSEKSKATKTEPEQETQIKASKPERVLRAGLKKLGNFFKTHKATATAVFNAPSEEVQAVLELAAAGKLRTLRISQRAKFRFFAEGRNARAEEERRVGTVHPPCPVTSSLISLVLPQDEAFKQGLAAFNALTASAPTQEAAPFQALTQTPRAAEANPFGDQNAIALTLRTSMTSLASADSTCSTSITEAPMPMATAQA